MSHPPLSTDDLPLSEQREFDERAASLQRRRVAASRVRQRRLLAGDLGVALLLAVFGLVLAPGLAILALGAFVVLIGCAVSLGAERLLARRRRVRRSVRASAGRRRRTAKGSQRR